MSRQDWSGGTVTLTAVELAEWLLRRCGPMSAVRLQKLVYYAQAWSLVWDERALFEEPIEAWAQGPVVPALYRRHQGRFRLAPGELIPTGVAIALDPQAQETLEVVIDCYAGQSSQWLVGLSCMEQPWKDCRNPLDGRSHAGPEIDQEAIRCFYAKL